MTRPVMCSTSTWTTALLASGGVLIGACAGALPFLAQSSADESVAAATAPDAGRVQSTALPSPTALAALPASNASTNEADGALWTLATDAALTSPTVAAAASYQPSATADDGVVRLTNRDNALGAVSATTASMSAAGLAEYAENLSAAFRNAAEMAEPSVARIVSYTRTNRANVLGQGSGTGFVFRSDETGSWLMTNNHVVADAMSLIVEFDAYRRYPADVVGVDPLTDLAVVYVDEPNLPAVAFADHDDLSTGDWVIAVGCPLGLEKTVTAGIVSATNRELGIIAQTTRRRGYEDYIQTDAAINKGNSGGPLVNLRGQVVGVNSAIVTQTGGSDGLGFAIPIGLARFISDGLIEHGRIRRGFLGVGLQELTPALAMSYGLPREQGGALVTFVDDTEAAGRAGIRSGDIIVAVDSEKVADASDLRTVVAMKEPGKPVAVSVIRDGQERRFSVTLGEMSDAAAAPEVMVFDAKRDGRLGARFAASDAYDGVQIVDPVLGGPAHLAGLESGDLVVEVNGRPVTDLAREAGTSPAVWLATRIESAKAGEVLRFKVNRVVRGWNGRRAVETLDTSYVGVELR